MKTLLFAEHFYSGSQRSLSSEKIFRAIYDTEITKDYQFDFFAKNYSERMNDDGEVFPEEYDECTLFNFSHLTNEDMKKGLSPTTKLIKRIVEEEYELMVFFESAENMVEITEALRKLKKERKFKTIWYCPDYANKNIIDFVSQNFDIVIPAIEKDFCKNSKNIIPFCADTEGFSKIEKDEKEKLKKKHFSEDSVIFSAIGENNPENNLPELIRAFSEMKKLDNKKILILHTTPVNECYNLFDVAEFYNLEKGKDIYFPMDSTLGYDIKESDIIKTLQMSDFFIQTARHEEFPLWAIRAEKCGAKLLVSKFGSSKILPIIKAETENTKKVFQAGLKMPPLEIGEVGSFYTVQEFQKEFLFSDQTIMSQWVEFFKNLKSEINISKKS